MLGALLLLAASAVSQVTVGVTAAEVGNSPGANRVSLTIRAHDGNSGICYCAPSSSVTTGTGLQLGAGDAYTWDYPGTASPKFYCICDAASQTLGVEETQQ